MMAHLAEERRNGFIPETSRDLSCLMTRALRAARTAEEELQLSNAVRRYLKDRIRSIRTTASKLAFAKEHFEEYLQVMNRYVWEVMLVLLITVHLFSLHEQ